MRAHLLCLAMLVAMVPGHANAQAIEDMTMFERYEVIGHLLAAEQPCGFSLASEPLDQFVDTAVGNESGAGEKILRHMRSAAREINKTNGTAKRIYCSQQSRTALNLGLM
jgi:hypothetical protein